MRASRFPPTMPELLLTTKTMGSLWRTAVSISMQLKPKAQSPLTLTTGTSGRASTVLGPLRHASGLALQLGQDLLHDGLGIADETNLHSAVDTNLLWLDVDLDDLGVRGELAAEAEHPGEPCPYHQDHVGVPH